MPKTIMPIDYIQPPKAEKLPRLSSWGNISGNCNKKHCPKNVKLTFPKAIWNRKIKSISVSDSTHGTDKTFLIGRLALHKTTLNYGFVLTYNWRNLIS